MYSKELAEHFEKYLEYEQDCFIKGNHNYWMLKAEKEVTIYDKDIKIFKYDEQHTEFLKALPLFTDKLEELETRMKNLYEYANSANYDSSIFKNHIIDISDYLQKKHIFLRSTDNSLLYIRRVLYEYFCRMVEYRFILYLDNNNIKKRSSTLSLQDLDSFREQDKEFLTRLFVPLYQLLYQDENNKESVINSKVNHLWSYFLYCSHCYNALNAKTDEFSLKAYLSKNYTANVRNKALVTPILKDFKIISDIFTDYFSVFSDMHSLFPQATNFFKYALLTSNNFFYEKIIESCTFYSSHQSMYKMITYHIRRMKPNHVAYMDTVGKDFTDNIYQRIKDSVDADGETKEKIMQELNEYYRKELEKNMGAEIIKFQYLEQLFAFELLDIILKNNFIKKCDSCKCYFITCKQNQINCDLHKNSHTHYQQTYTNNLTSYQKIYNSYVSCFYKRMKRGIISYDDFDNWKKEATKLTSKFNSENISQNEFITELDFLCKEYNIDIPRKYNKNR